VHGPQTEPSHLGILCQAPSQAGPPANLAAHLGCNHLGSGRRRPCYPWNGQPEQRSQPLGQYIRNPFNNPQSGNQPDFNDHPFSIGARLGCALPQNTGMDAQVVEYLSKLTGICAQDGRQSCRSGAVRQRRWRQPGCSPQKIFP